ncbi:Holo-[acyl-carrier-protein] synthase [Saliniradius amylolyticus]|uniref:Holo-[acyl-carrier-protein] synthase n=1 Tax=Saliniradius amylolyticus TaxID=2183582 RepID=A0A2S2E061_9ALTE|nr:holo-ACP synthase [Saliniradius amylolyticus]AWL11016.1 Holo-[acyl-carrier-protein] synthase [Saliniradius amylolyticus]
MAILGLGTDIVETARIEAQLERSNKLSERILTDTEQAELAKQKYPARFLAKRFAAKEAAVKAAGTGIGNGISFQQMEIRHLPSGQPILHLEGALLEHCHQLGVVQSHISITDEQHYAVATVILEGEDGQGFSAPKV